MFRPATIPCASASYMAVFHQQHRASSLLKLTSKTPNMSSYPHLRRQDFSMNIDNITSLSRFSTPSSPSASDSMLSKRWMEYQGINNWEGLLDPIDHNLRGEILRYGQFVEAAYRSFDFDPSSPTYATCKFPRSSLLTRSGIGDTGYRPTKNLRATCGIQLPKWLEKAPRWVTTGSSWVGYVAVCQDKDEISRLGRRDVVIAYRGTVTCMEWLENIRTTLTSLDETSRAGTNIGSTPMVEKGFLSLYTSESATFPSLRDTVREEVRRIIKKYGDEPLSITITGHSMGAALATLTAYDIKDSVCNNSRAMVTVVSFGGPRLGNRRFRWQLEKSGSRMLRIVNSDDVITKVPGFVVEAENGMLQVERLLEKMQWDYSDVGQELRLSSRESPYLRKANLVTCHELSTYLHLVSGFVSSKCPFRATAKRMIKKASRAKASEATKAWV